MSWFDQLMNSLDNWLGAIVDNPVGYDEPVLISNNGHWNWGHLEKKHGFVVTAQVVDDGPYPKTLAIATGYDGEMTTICQVQLFQEEADPGVMVWTYDHVLVLDQEGKTFHQRPGGEDAMDEKLFIRPVVEAVMRELATALVDVAFADYDPLS